MMNYFICKNCGGRIELDMWDDGVCDTCGVKCVYGTLDHSDCEEIEEE